MAKQKGTGHQISWLACVLVALFAAGLSLATWHSFDPLSDPDGCEYMIGGISLMTSHRLLDMSGHPQVLFSPGYPILIGFVWKAVSNPVLAGRVISLVSSALSAALLLLIATHFFGKRVGISTAIIYSVLPIRVALSNAVMSESLYVFTLFAGVWLWIGVCERPNVLRAVATGLIFGIAYLVRAEGIICAAALLALSLPIHKWWKRPSPKSLAIIAAALAIVIIPNVLYIHAHSGKWTLSPRGKYNIQVGIARSYNVPWAKMHRLDRTKTNLERSFLSESKSEFVRRFLINTRQEAVHLQAMLGLFLTSALLLGIMLELYRNNRALIDALPVVLVMGAPIIYLPALLIQDRYLFMAIAPVLMLACWQLVTRFKPNWPDTNNRRARFLAMLPLIVVTLSFLKEDIWLARNPEPLSNYPSIAKWVENKTPAGSSIITSSEQIAFYANRKCMPLPYEPVNATLRYAQYHGIEYILITSKDLLSTDMQKLIRGARQSTGVKRVGMWKGSGSDWAVLYNIKPIAVSKRRSLEVPSAPPQSNRQREACAV